jgi:ammonium transporter, Amt family
MGDLHNIGLKGVPAQPDESQGNLPEVLVALFRGMFAAFTSAWLIGAAAERGRIGASLIFIFIWTTIVYDPIASWTWNNSGWAAQLGVLDFAGGTPVHISSGAAALAYSKVLKPRKGIPWRNSPYFPV